jgi:quercetin dioxygenase-like cupin family protein
MRTSWILATFLTAALAAFPAAKLIAQSGAKGPVWETLLQAPLPENVEPIISVNSLLLPLAPPVPPPVGTGHTHADPVIAYIVQGEIENQVEPDPPAIYKTGGFFYEAPMHVHRILRNLSTTEPAQLIIFQAGRTRVPAPFLKVLQSESAKLLLSRDQFQQPLLSTVNQELSLLRLTLPAGARSEARAHSGPGFVYVLEGNIETSGATDHTKTYSAGDLFLEPASRVGFTFRNASGSEPAKLLLYHVSTKGT